MKRKALIIYCTNTKSGELLAVENDFLNMKSYLMSCMGGCWEEGEIIALNNPTKNEVTQCIHKNFRDVDYAFVMFSGHGYVDSSDGLQRVEVKDEYGNDNMIIVDLFTPAPRQTIIIDACRKLYDTRLITESRKLFSSTTQKISDDKKEKYRTLFDACIGGANEGTNVIFATSKGSPSICKQNGSVFINSMIEKCTEFFNNTANAKKVLNTEDVVNMIGSIEVEFEDRKMIQKPEVRIFNDSVPFPIAIGNIPMIRGIKYDKETKRFRTID